METSHLSAVSQDAIKAARTELFRQLKPLCVSVAGLTINPPTSAAGSRELSQRIEEIFAIVNARVATNRGILSDGLSDYIFWPLSRIFAQRDKFSLPVIEGALRGVSVLISKGWSATTFVDLFPQLLLLFSTLLGGVPDTEKQNQHLDLAEETMQEALRAIRTIFETSRDLPGAGGVYNSSNAVTQVGNTLAVVLNCAHSPVSADIQIEALATLEAAISAMRDTQVLAGFFPGIVSSVSKLLIKPSQRTRVLVKGLSALQIILTRVLSNFEVEIRTQRFDKSGQEDLPSLPYSREWLKTTQEQTRVVVGTVLRLQLSDSESVRNAVEDLCIKVLDECHKSLGNCSDILVDAAIMVMSTERLDSLMETSLKELCMIHENTVLEQVRKSAFDRARNFGSVMQMGDGTKQQRYLRFLVNALTLLSQIKKKTGQPALIHRQILNGLQEAFNGQNQWIRTGERVVLDDEDLDTVETTTKSLISEGINQQVFRPLALSHDSQREARSLISELIDKLGNPEDKSKYANSLIPYAQDTSDRHNFSSFWLAFKLVQSALEDPGDELDMFTVFPDDDVGKSDSPQGNPQATLQELYTLAGYIITPQILPSDVDWRSRALALEVIEYTARRAQQDFRPELMDVLFPVSTLLGDEHPEVRRHALVTLNALAAHCQYRDVSELIVQNADYMVNAVALQIDSLNLTPAMINVLVMMTRLTGPKIIPYLDDVIHSIFSALDNYHGYPNLVEALFTVLKEVVDQGVKSQTLLIESGESSVVDHRKKRPAKPSMEEVIKQIETIKLKRKERDEEDRKIDEDIRSGHPKKPWAELSKGSSRIQELLDEHEEPEGSTSSQEGNEDEKVEEDDQPIQEGGDDEENKPKKTITYTLLNRIANLTQNYLTFPSPYLRKQLLGLLATVSSALSSDPDSFLPLINDIWPVTITRLYDSEGFVTIAACETLSALCVNAGDFLTSRFKTEWKAGMHKWCIKAKEQAAKATGNKSHRGLISTIDSSDVSIRMPLGDGKVLEPKKDASENSASQLEISGGLGSYALAVKVWEAVVDLLVAIVGHVSVPAEMFDEMLDLVADLLVKKPDVKEVFDVINADAVWLVMYERGEVKWEPTPQIDGWDFVAMTKGIGYPGPDKVGEA
ncbi:hypothetical protein jhhlp_000882 [Lomentospora prolificans]|uniref:Uncharacterized protein n=1 Tax=Lomentospora prolificans TaxID=41688 RepID=A0A2N3NJS0_9PEZI|nr:hypothetical protein jhhlp_000882 [Lomentospora prolificans]